LTSFSYPRTGPVPIALVLCVACQGNPVSELPSEQEKDTGWAGAAGSFGSAGSAGEETVGLDAGAGGKAASEDAGPTDAGHGEEACKEPCPLVYDQPVRDLAVDATHVYYSSGHGIWKVAKAGGAPTELALGLVRPTTVKLTSDAVVVLDYKRRIVTVRKTGETVTPLLEDGDGFAQFWDIAVHEDFVVFLRTSTDHDGVVMTLPLAGGAPTVLAETDIGCWPQVGHGLALSPTHAYWGEGLSIKRVALNGGEAETVSIADDHAHALAVGPDHVYWAGSLGGISFAPLEGGPATAVQGGGMTGAIAVGSASVYWTSEPSLLRAGLGSTYGQVLRNGVTQVSGVGVDGEYVYFGSSSETGVSLAKVAK
jgi:hypothetical protein